MVMNVYFDKKNNFYELFNPQNGFLIRSDDEYGNVPIQRDFPELLDIGIMGHCESKRYGICKAAGIDCYQAANEIYKPNMSLADYSLIINQIKGKVFQVALGGAGDPNKHIQFEKILYETRCNNIVPNYTTSGMLLSKKEAEITKLYCGAVAVSWYSRLDAFLKETNSVSKDAVNLFLSCGCTTNIHFVVSTDTIDEAIFRLEKDMFPQGINAVVFILYKPIGLGKEEKVIKNDEKLLRFLEQAVNIKHPYKVGFDTCFTSALVNFLDEDKLISVDFCEAARFSMYIDCDLNAFPCSFGYSFERFSSSLRNKSICDIWNGEKFSAFRDTNNCRRCEKFAICLGGCKLNLPINLCGRDNFDY